MWYDLETPAVEEETTEEAVATDASPRVEKLLKVFEALNEDERLEAFDKISVIMLPDEWTPMDNLDPAGVPITEGLPYSEDDATAQKFNAMQDKLQDF